MLVSSSVLCRVRCRCVEALPSGPTLPLADGVNTSCFSAFLHCSFIIWKWTPCFPRHCVVDFFKTMPSSCSSGSPLRLWRHSKVPRMGGRKPWKSQNEIEIKKLVFLNTKIATWIFCQVRLCYSTLRNVGAYVSSHFLRRNLIAAWAPCNSPWGGSEAALMRRPQLHFRPRRLLPPPSWECHPSFLVLSQPGECICLVLHDTH